MQNNFAGLHGVFADQYQPNSSESLASLPPWLEEPTQFLNAVAKLAGH